MESFGFVAKERGISTGQISHLLVDLSKYSWAHIITTYWPGILNEAAQ
jgi:hypothetical protein